jgi:integrase
MPRKRKLDRYVTSFVDRHNKERFRFRRGGVSRYLPPPGSPEYREAYAEAMSGAAGQGRAKKGTVGDLVARFYQSVPFRNAGPSWQRTMRQVIEPFREEARDQRVADFKARHINVLLGRKMQQTVVEGKKQGGTASAKRLREVLLRLFEFAVSEEMIATNPVEKAADVTHKAKGFYAWTEADIAQFRAHWPLGTKARLAIELMLWTGSRRGNAHRMAPPTNGRFKAIAVKTGKPIDMQVAPALQAAIDAMPAAEIGSETLIVTSHGKPFSAAGFGNKVREWCDAAGLPKCTSHGLRKALARRAADIGTSQQGIKSLGQWSGDEEVKTYVETANRSRLADSALAEVAEWERTSNVV